MGIGYVLAIQRKGKVSAVYFTPLGTTTLRKPQKITKKGTVNVQLHTREPKSPNKNPFPNKGRIKAQNSRKALEDFITWTCHPQE